ncbi:MAG: hypothetical protein LBD58_13380, partial [Treponema sp.]|nr:hypothetical protein [Treponema sp.]
GRQASIQKPLKPAAWLASGGFQTGAPRVGSTQPRVWVQHSPACGINAAPRVGSARPRVTG